MSYEGWLIKIGKWQMPFRWIEPASYKVTPAKTKLYEWTDYDGGRHVVYNLQSQTKITFETKGEPFRLNDEHISVLYEALETARSSHVSDGLNADTYNISYYNPATGGYETRSFTMDDVEFTIERVTKEKPQHVVYNPVQFTFTEAKDLDL